MCRWIATLVVRAIAGAGVLIAGVLVLLLELSGDIERGAAFFVSLWR